MGKIKEMVMAELELLAFHELQKELIKHKYLYYVKSAPIISDYNYDMLEEKSLKLARTLGFRADKWEGPEENEKDHVHWMVDFDESHPLAKEFMKEVDGE
jgi:hypothetical protein